MKKELLSQANELNSKISFLEGDIEKLKHEKKISITAGRSCTPDLWSITDEDDKWLKRVLIGRFKKRLIDLEKQLSKL